MPYSWQIGRNPICPTICTDMQPANSSVFFSTLLLEPDQVLFLIARTKYNCGMSALSIVASTELTPAPNRSDFVYMAPPFIAYYGILQGGDDEPRLLMTAYDQCRLYRDALHDPASGLWRHVVYGNWQDNSHWATGRLHSKCSILIC